VLDEEFGVIKLKKSKKTTKDNKIRQRLITLLLSILLCVTVYQVAAKILAAQNNEDAKKQVVENYNGPAAEMETSNLYENQLDPRQLKDAIENKEDVMVYYYQPTCQYCAQAAPIVEKLKEELEIDLKVFNLTDYSEGWQEYAVKGTPTIVKYENGYEVARLEGLQEPNRFEQWFTQYK
jgi:thiol-disulfide isomerase/thioredoxin